MEALRQTSRSIINDVVFAKVQKSRYANHLNAIKSPNNLNKFYRTQKSNSPDAKKLLQYKNAFKSVNFQINPMIIERRSLVKKLQAIDKRKSMSTNTIPQLQNSRQRQIQQKLIKENRMFFSRIKEQRQNIMSRLQLKKQGQQIQKMIMHSRKIKQTIKKGKPKNKKKFLLNFKKDQINFQLKKDSAFQDQYMKQTKLVKLQIR